MRRANVIWRIVHAATETFAALGGLRHDNRDKYDLRPLIGRFLAEFSLAEVATVSIRSPEHKSATEAINKRADADRTPSAAEIKAQNQWFG